MDKNKLLDILGRDITHKDAEIIIYDYCIENGKDESETDKFILLLKMTPFMNACFSIALDYYKRKFNITSVIDANNNTLKNY